MIGVVQLPGDKRFVSSLRGVSVENHFYTIEGHKNGPDAFEKLLSEWEAKAKPAFDKVERGVWPLNPEDRRTLAFFLTVQAVRGADTRRDLGAINEGLIRLKEYVEKKLGPMSADSQDFIPRRVEVSPEDHVSHILAVTDSLLPYFEGRAMGLVRFQRRSLLTSDKPISMVPSEDHHPSMGMGFGTAGALSVPLSRRLGLLLVDPMTLGVEVPFSEVARGACDTVTTGTTALQKSFDHYTVSHASKWLYHHPDEVHRLPTRLPNPTLTNVRFDGLGAE